MKDKFNTYNLGVIGAILVLLGTFFPSFFAIYLQPKQPDWESAEVFIEHYNIVQTVPFYFGFLLVAGSMIILIAIYLLSNYSSYSLLGLVFGLVGTVIVSLNYIIQTTFIPSVVAAYIPIQSTIIYTFSMANPTSLAWALEMWGYGFIGLGTWFAAPFFTKTGIERIAKVLFILNGILSIVGAFWTALDLGWVLTLPGLISFALWNILYFTLAGVTIRVFLRRKRSSVSVPG